MISHLRHFLPALAVQLAFVSALSSAPVPRHNPDLTKGEPIPSDAKHDWTLGATGARGWMYCDTKVTTDARQIAITEVAKGSPAVGVLKVGDVILGVAGKPFSYDPRTEFGKALTDAESNQGAGKLALIRWSEGKQDEPVVMLPVLGDYSATAPYDCPKSKRILEQGCKALAKRIAAPGYKPDPIPRSLNALALLASGNSEYLPVVKQEAQWAADFKADSMQSWYYGYVMMLLSEYSMATGDQSVMPGLKRLALEAANGQSAVGSWGHRFAKPDGRLYGYGMMNAPGVPLTISLVLARAAGIKDPAVDLAIERSAKLLRFYIGKGAIPYGDHAPWTQNHDDNGKCGMAATLFNLLGDEKGAEFFGRMCLASHGAERDCGHTGNYFNILWAMPGVAQSGPQATGAWMKEFCDWYFDLARQWDGTFRHQGAPEPDNDTYSNFDATGGYLLAYAMPLKKLYLTGKRPFLAPQLDAAAAHSIILDGRGWNNKDRNSGYDQLDDDSLFERLGSWSPTVRERASLALARRKELSIDPLLVMLKSPRLEARLGACEELALLGGKAAPAVPLLTKLLRNEDLWLRIQAAEALAQIGAPAMGTVPEMLEMLVKGPTEKDPRGMEQRYLCTALFGTMLKRSLEGVDRKLLDKAVAAGLHNQDGAARGQIGGIYQQLTYDEIKPLLPAIYEAIVKPAPSGEMFASEIQMSGLKLFAKFHIAQGMELLAGYCRTQNVYSSENRTVEIMDLLKTYGANAKRVIPQLQSNIRYFENEETDFPHALSLRKAACVKETIAFIESSTEKPTLIDMAG
jgi:hypothetical protein